MSTLDCDICDVWDVCGCNNPSHCSISTEFILTRTPVSLLCRVEIAEHFIFTKVLTVLTNELSLSIARYMVMGCQCICSLTYLGWLHPICVRSYSLRSSLGLFDACQSTCPQVKFRYVLEENIN